MNTSTGFIGHKKIEGLHPRFVGLKRMTGKCLVAQFEHEHNRWALDHHSLLSAISQCNPKDPEDVKNLEAFTQGKQALEAKMKEKV